MLLLLAAATLNILDFQASTTASNNAAAIQRAIDQAAGAGGGTVEIPAGRFLSGTIHLRDNIRLQLQPGAVLAMSTNDADFAAYEPAPVLLSKRVTAFNFSKRDLLRNVSLPPTEDDSETTYMRYALVLAEGVHNVSITGPGTIDGNRTKRGGPKPIAIKNSSDVTLRDITVANAPNYAVSLMGSDHITVDNIKILNAYADGIDPDSCRFVRISNSYIDSHDDAICPKASLALGRRAATEHLTVTNCTLRTACSAFKFGTESAGDFKNVTVSNLTILRRDTNERPPLAAIALESVDGANIDSVTITNISIRDASTPIFIRLGARGRGMDTPKAGSIARIAISNVVATGAKIASSITASSGSTIRDVVLRDIHIETSPASEPAPNQTVPELAEKYPEATMFGDLPASALFARNVEALKIDGFSVRTPTAAARPVIRFENVRRSRVTGFDPPPVTAPHLPIQQTESELRIY